MRNILSDKINEDLPKNVFPVPQTGCLIAVGQVAFDHNFAQRLSLQSIYGAGVGYTAFSTPRRQLDPKATVQYESQRFIQSPAVIAPSVNLVGSTFSLSYIARLKPMTYTQGVAFIPSCNVSNAYSAYETNTLAFRVYKSLSFAVGILDSYLNNPPVSVPATKRNSFQLTMGLSYAIKSRSELPELNE